MPQKPSYSRILVPLDGSQLAEHSLPLAAALAIRSRSDLILLRVTGAPSPHVTARRTPALARAGTNEAPSSPPSVVPPGAGRPDEDPAEGRRYLEAIASSASLPAAQVSVETATGEPSEAILQVAERLGAGLVVMATHGRSGLARGVLGSVTDRVALRSGVPVLIVRAGQRLLGIPPARLAVQWVLVPLDQSELSESALPHALEVASIFGARLKLLTVVRSWVGPDQVDAATWYLNELATEIDPTGARVRTRAVVGEPELEIAAQVRLLQDPMIVMTTRGASGLKRWLRGSVTDAIVRSALAPTMVVPPVAPLLGSAIY